MHHFPHSAWEHHASVKTKPRLIFQVNQAGDLFPRAKQLLSVHPRVTGLGEDAMNFLLTQSFYKYTHDIAHIETCLINTMILDASFEKAFEKHYLPVFNNLDNFIKELGRKEKKL